MTFGGGDEDEDDAALFEARAARAEMGGPPGRGEGDEEDEAEFPQDFEEPYIEDAEYLSGEFEGDEEVYG